MNPSLSLAPIVLFCYNRPRHLRQTVQSLQSNSLASQSDLYVYSDGPKKESDTALIAEIRNYLPTIEGFKSITIVSAQTNKGLANAILSGVTEILKKYNKVIVLEDDMLSAPDFLNFMNDALNVFESRADVFSVSGYTPPITIPDHYDKDVYLAPRASSWGWGTWVEKWSKADWEVKNFKDNPDIRAELGKGGSDLWPMLQKQQLGVIDSWAIRWTYTQFMQQAYGLYPVHSKIQNIGTDGTGTNFTFKSAHYGKELSSGKVVLDPDLKPDAQVMDTFRKYYNLPVQVKIKNWVKYRI